jgi:hypothetical protein
MGNHSDHPVALTRQLFQRVGDGIQGRLVKRSEALVQED